MRAAAVELVAAGLVAVVVVVVEEVAGELAGVVVVVLVDFVLAGDFVVEGDGDVFAEVWA